MKLFSTKIHGVMDYLMGLVLISAPWLLGFGDTDLASRVPMVLGIILILYSLMTDYELGAYKTISMRTHLWLDGISGLFLAISPWVFGFSDVVYMPHLVLGLAEFMVAVTTDVVPKYEERPHRRTTRRHSHA